jgi:hypothetical protein
MGRYPNISDHGLIGDLQTAALTLQKMHTCANHPGLCPEETGRTGGQFGSLPQAFSHRSLINAAISPGYQLDHGPGRSSRCWAGIRRIPAAGCR